MQTLNEQNYPYTFDVLITVQFSFGDDTVEETIKGHNKWHALHLAKIEWPFATNIQIKGANMYKAEYTKAGQLKHSTDCKMVFGKKDDQCPRCAEMIAGSPAREGWQKDYFKIKKMHATQGLNELTRDSGDN